LEDIAGALAAALRDLFTGRMLRLAWWPVVGALVAWTLIFWLGWEHWKLIFLSLVQAGPLDQWLGAGVATALGSVLAWIVLLPALLAMVLLTSLVVTSLVAVPVMLRDLSAGEYADLERRHGGTLLGSLVNAAVALVVFLLLVVLSVPLWLIVPFGFLLFPLLLNGWLNARLFRYDALAEHASRDEFRTLLRRDRGAMLALGVLLALPPSIPGVGFLAALLAPIYAVYVALAFIHFLFRRLRRLRAEGASRPVVR
jgi:Protein of unknown function (DUF540).